MGEGKRRLLSLEARKKISSKIIFLISNYFFFFLVLFVQFPTKKLKGFIKGLENSIKMEVERLRGLRAWKILTKQFFFFFFFFFFLDPKLTPSLRALFISKRNVTIYFTIMYILHKNSQNSSANDNKKIHIYLMTNIIAMSFWQSQKLQSTPWSSE